MEGGMRVLPIFYLVEPSNVWVVALEEDFEEVFAKHEVLDYVKFGFLFDPICNLAWLVIVSVLNEIFCEVQFIGWRLDIFVRVIITLEIGFDVIKTVEN